MCGEYSTARAESQHPSDPVIARIAGRRCRGHKKRAAERDIKPASNSPGISTAGNPCGKNIAQPGRKVNTLPAPCHCEAARTLAVGPALQGTIRSLSLTFSRFPCSDRFPASAKQGGGSIGGGHPLLSRFKGDSKGERFPRRGKCLRSRQKGSEIPPWGPSLGSKDRFLGPQEMVLERTRFFKN